MNWLLLRGAVPIDRDHNEIIFSSIKETDDMWSLLFQELLDESDYGEIWYYGKTGRNHRMSNNLVERWVGNYGTYETNFSPDIIFARGAFIEYHKVFYRFPKSLKIRYGAGRRFFPQQGFYDYDIILQDSPEQVKICEAKFPKVLTTLFIKPAADNIFYPIEQEKEFDVCFPANGSQPFKGHGFVYGTVPKDIKLLNLGNTSKTKYPNNVTSYRVLRKEMAEHYAKCKVGIVTVAGNIDSCPRIISEMLACDLPIIVLDEVRFWKDKYIESAASSRSPFSTGEITNKASFWDYVRFVLNNLELYAPRKYYEENLSLEKSAKFIMDKIDEVSK